MADTDPAPSLHYPDLLTEIDREIKDGHTESRAFLAWVLRHFYRLDDQDVKDAICDGPDDKGVDGIYVDRLEDRIDVFQSRIAKNPKKEIGDTGLKEFSGTLDQFETADAIEQIADTTKNVELKGLLIDQDIAGLVRAGFAVRGVFVTNTSGDDSARSYLEKAPHIRLVDSDDLRVAYIPAERPRSDREPFALDVFGVEVISYPIDKERTVYVTYASAEDLVQMEGIESRELFDPNVRKWIGRTKVNKDIAKSVRDAGEHKNFALYHNGVTIICSGVDTEEKGKLILSGYSIINGCQSIVTFFDNQNALTKDLRVLTRVVRIPDEPALVDKITHNTNNQNEIKARDFKSNNPIQVRLQNEFKKVYSGEVFYQVSRGETSECPLIIENELAARILLAFDLREPWGAHQAYRLFDDLYARIFGRPEVTAARIWAFFNVYEEVESRLNAVRNERLGSYTLTKFFLLYLLAEALSGDEKGREFIRDPESFLNEDRGVERLRAAIGRILDDLIVDLNAEVDERDQSGAPLDYKRDLKSPVAVRRLGKDIVSSYLKLVQRGRMPSFSEDWQESGS